jgi:hypothetical protein
MGKIKTTSADQVQQEKLEAEKKRIERNRRRAYEQEADPLYLKWQRGEATEQQWLDKIEEIRNRFPKPDES